MKSKFLILWVAGIIGTAAVLPYAFALQHDIIAKAGRPLHILVLASVVQTAVLLAIALLLGLKLAQSLRLPILGLFDSNEPLASKIKRVIFLAIPVGIVTAVVIVLGDKLFSQHIPQISVVNSQVAAWKTLLASLYGGIAEEILTRLFLVSFFAWGLSKIFRPANAITNGTIMWSAIIISAILFGLGHLPITSSITHITPLVITRAIVLNGIGGIIFGWLYWKKGLEYSMAAHFTTDIVLLTILPALLK